MLEVLFYSIVFGRANTLVRFWGLWGSGYELLDLEGFGGWDGEGWGLGWGGCAMNEQFVCVAWVKRSLFSVCCPRPDVEYWWEQQKGLNWADGCESSIHRDDYLLERSGFLVVLLGSCVMYLPSPIERLRYLPRYRRYRERCGWKGSVRSFKWRHDCLGDNINSWLSWECWWYWSDCTMLLLSQGQLRTESFLGWWGISKIRYSSDLSSQTLFISWLPRR